MATRRLSIFWRCMYCVFAKWLPQSCYSSISNGLRVFFAKRIAQIGSFACIERNATFGDALVLGDRSGVGRDCEIRGSVHIGNDVMMAPEVVIYTKNHAHASLDIPMSAQGDEEEKPVYVGNDVWIGRRAMIMPGSTIGDHVIVAAGAVVTGDVPSCCVVGGVPARVLKQRDENE